MDFQQYLDWTYFGDEKFDAVEFARLGELFEGVDTFIDVGASHGVYTFHALRYMNQGRIIAIEADPERFAVLKANVAKWSSTSNATVECLMAAASDDLDIQENPTATFFTTGTQISGGLFPVSERSDDYAPIEVPCVKLDAFLVADESVLVKIDVEGAELRVLKGSAGLIRSGKTRFFVEISWWGDRGRKTSLLSTLRFVFQSKLGIERRLRSDYLLFPEPSGLRRSLQVTRVLLALLPRYAFNAFVPSSTREVLIRRQNERRLARAPRSNRAPGESA